MSSNSKIKERIASGSILKEDNRFHGRQIGSCKTAYHEYFLKKGNFDMIRKIVVAMMAILFCASLATAADQIKKKDQQQDRKKDGSCKMIQVDNEQNQKLAADQIRTRNPIKDRKKDGTCKVALIEDDALSISADQIRKRNPDQDRKRDGSCQN